VLIPRTSKKLSVIAVCVVFMMLVQGYAVSMYSYPVYAGVVNTLALLIALALLVFSRK
jgi:hypothetical protein